MTKKIEQLGGTMDMTDKDLLVDLPNYTAVHDLTNWLDGQGIRWNQNTGDALTVIIEVC